MAFRRRGDPSLRLWFRSTVRIEDEDSPAPGQGPEEPSGEEGPVTRESAAEEPISAKELPSAAAELERMFPSEESTATADVAGKEQEAEELNAEHLPGNWDALPEVTITPEPAKPSMRAEDLPSAAQTLAEMFPEENREREESAPEETSAAREQNSEGEILETIAPEGAAEGTEQEEDDVPPAITEMAASRVAVRSYDDWAFEEKLASHREWVESHGGTGQQ